MTTLIPLPAYKSSELSTLYPPNLTLVQSQVLLRHGERAPVNARFQNAGLPAHWPYCNAARNMRSIVLTDTSKWDALEWQRRLETFSTGLSAKSPSKSLFSNAASLLTGSSADQGDNVALATSVGGEINGICQLGELTDKGRETSNRLVTSTPVIDSSCFVQISGLSRRTNG